MKMGRKSKAVALFIGVISALLSGVVTIMGDEGDTLVGVDPVSQTVAPGETFTVNVSCVPGQPVKSFELKLSFDASLVQANSVTEGDIFDGYDTFFESGTIDNVAGTIVDVYGLIIGAGNVSNPGILVTIGFTAQTVTGVSGLDLYDVGVTNESTYVPLVVSNGSVLVDATPPAFDDNSPSQGFTGDFFLFNVSVTDNVDSADDLTVRVDWSHGTKGDNESMAHAAGSYFEKSVTLDLYSTSDLLYTFYAEDSRGNRNTTMIASVMVVDNDPPDFGLVVATPGVQEIGGYVNLSAVVTDNIGMGDVFLNITYPDSSIENISITDNKTGSIYYCNKTYTLLGVYAYFLWADDAVGNSDVSDPYFFVIGDGTPPEISNVVRITSDPLDTDEAFGWVNISGDVTDNAAVDDVYLNITDLNGVWNNVSMNPVDTDTFYYQSNTAFSSSGNYSYFIWANDTSGNSGFSSGFAFSMPPNWDINNDGGCSIFDLVLISNHYGETGAAGWIREDVDNSGEIEVLDLVLASNNYDISWWM